MTIPIQPTDLLPDPGTDAGWQALETEAHQHGYPDAQAYLGAYEQGRINVGAAGFQPGNAHTGFGQVQAYDRAAAQAGESLHDFAEQHTPEALARDRGELPPEHQQGPGFDRHALRDEAHLHGFHSTEDYVRAWEHGEIFSAKGDPGYREVTKLTDAATGHQESPSQYFDAHRHDHGGHDDDPGHSPHGVDPGQIDQHVDPSVGTVDNPYLHDWDWFKDTDQPHVPGDPDPGQIDPTLDPGGAGHAVSYPGSYVGPVTVGPDGTRTLPDGSHLSDDGHLRIYPNGNVQDPSGHYLGDYHGEWNPVHVDPTAGPDPVGPDHGMDGDPGGHIDPSLNQPEQVIDIGHLPGGAASGSVPFGGGATPGNGAGSDPGFGGGDARVHPGTVHGQDGTDGMDGGHVVDHDIRTTDQTGSADQAEHDTSHEQHVSEGHGSDAHSSSSHQEDDGGRHESSHDSGGLEHHVG